MFKEQGFAFRPFNIDKPLWIFVGGSVTKTLASRDASDIIEIMKFLSRYVSDRSASIERIERVLTQGLVKIGRASCRERVGQSVSISVVAVSLKKKKKAVISN